CLCDANVMFEPQALRLLVAQLADAGVGAVTGDVRLASHDSNFGTGESVYYRIERAIQTCESRIGTTVCVDGGMYVVRRELYGQLPVDTILDDFVTSMNVLRRRKSVVFEPRAVAHENGLPLARQEFWRRVRVSAGAVQAVKRGNFPPCWRVVEFWQFVSHKLLRWAGPAWLALLLVSSSRLWDQGAVFQSALVGQALLYLLAAAATVSVRFRATSLGGPPFYFVMSHVAMVIGTLKGLFNLQGAAWNRTERSHLEIRTQATTGAT
ncbi:MAG TPA: glycosyltransferase, partial [Planctomycetaceae bacterium]|nr:glycosyltransferase [Planctomycetaceae bacterium]